MKSKKLLFVAVLLGVLLIAWVTAIGAAGNKEQIAAQNALVASADAFAEKDLYIRAIPKYEEALTYKTDQNRAIEEKLLAVYLEYGDADSYIALAQSRMNADAATEGEYLALAQLYLSLADTEEALAAAKEGMRRFDSAACKDLYEQNRYAYTVFFTHYEEILASRGGTYLPARDAAGMTAVNIKGKSAIDDRVYPYISRYNDSGYAVVGLEEGGFAVVTGSGDRYSLDENGLTSVLGITDSRIIAEKDGVYGIYNADFKLCSVPFEDATLAADGYLFAKSGGKWGILNEKNAMPDPDEPDAPVAAFLFEDVARNALDEAFAGGIAAVKHEGKWFYITPGAKKVIETPFACARAPEDDTGYLAVADENGKWGFIDRSGTLIIDYQYDDAHSFSQNLAAVKRGDEWFYISCDNVPVITSVFYDAGAFHGGAAIADTPNGTAILVLDYPNA